MLLFKRLRNCLLIIFLFFTYTLSCNAQDLAKEFKDYKDAIKGDFKVVPSFRLADLFQQENFQQNNLDSAFYYIQNSLLFYDKMNKKEAKHVHGNNIQKEQLLLLKKGIQKKVFERAKRTNNTTELQNLLLHFEPDTLLKKQTIALLRNRWSAKVNEVNRTDLLSKLHRDQSAFLGSHLPDVLEWLEYKILNLSVKHQGWIALDAFSQQFPASPFVNHPSKAAYLQIKETDSSASIVRFLSDNPDSPYRFFAEAQLAQLEFIAIEKSDSLEEWATFAMRYPNFEDLNKVDDKMATLIGQHKMIYVIEDNLTALPMENLQKTTEAVFDVYKQTGLPGYIKDFSIKYPHFSNNNDLKKELELADSYKALPRKYQEEHKADFEAFIKKAAPRDIAFTILLKTVEEPIEQENWAKVLNTAKANLTQFGKDNTMLNDLIKIAGSPAEAGIKKSAILSLNSNEDEYSPVIAADNQRFYFCRKVDGKEQIFVSEMNEEQWSEPYAIDALKRGGDRAPLSVSSDGSELLIFDSGKIRASQRGSSGWSKPASYSNVINSSRWQGGTTLSSDGNILIYAGSRSDVIGIPTRQNIDLFVSFKNEKGEWSTPKNLGFVLNTTYSERSPFLHPDMKTLYFSSSGHGGLGALDVYKTTRLDDTWINWSKPVNMGKMINTPDDDWGYSISTDGQLAYFSTNSESGKHQDIFSVNVPKDFQPEKVSTISGVLTNSKGKPLDAAIIIEDLGLNEVITSVKSNPVTGEFFIVLPDNRLYGYTVEKDGYFPASGNIDLRKATAIQRIERTIKLAALNDLVAQKSSLPIENLFFETNKAIIQSTSYPALNRLAELIIKNNFNLILEGHTDDVGSDSYNLNLSQQRADAVKDYLISKGCTSTKISAEGFGENKPIADNNTEEGKAKNRRVELRLAE